jgi:hypothetical protein
MKDEGCLSRREHTANRIPLPAGPSRVSRTRLRSYKSRLPLVAARPYQRCVSAVWLDRGEMGRQDSAT